MSHTNTKRAWCGFLAAVHNNSTAAVHCSDVCVSPVVSRVLCMLLCHVQEIRQLLISKYGKQYDLSFVRRNLPGTYTPSFCGCVPVKHSQA